MKNIGDSALHERNVIVSILRLRSSQARFRSGTARGTESADFHRGAAAALDQAAADIDAGAHWDDAVAKVRA